MTFGFWIDCFKRMLLVTFDNVCEDDREHIEDIVDGAYCCWHDCDSIEDEEYRQYVEASCLDEYIVECLVNEGFTVKEWHSEEED